MTVLAAPDSFKGNLSASQVCGAIEEGVLRADSRAAVLKTPLADGGEGTAQAVTEAAGGRFVTARVTGPLGDPVEARFGLIREGRTAVLDMASASGMGLVSRERLNPLKAGSYGTGELIAAALDSGARELIIGIGGSAVNDGGFGMLRALGYEFFDKAGTPVRPSADVAADLERIARIDAGKADKRLQGMAVKVACDVTNPLLGERGASAVFGPQKGASPEMVKALDSGLAVLASAWIRAGWAENVEQPGDGAAGGLGAALRICLGGIITSGARLVMEYAGFFDRLKEADLVITGEGRTDSQTAAGKLCCAVALESRQAGVPAALLSGALAEESQVLLETFDYAVSISRGQEGLDTMIRDSRRDLAFASENLIRAIKIGGRRRYGTKP